MDQLKVGNPRKLSTDVGPVIDQLAKDKIVKHCEQFKAQGKLLKTIADVPEGLYVAPTVLKVTGIEELGEEIFGPILHVATFKGKDLARVIDTINAQKYGLTFGVHSRVDARVHQLSSKIKAGNTYINRNQIGAIVGSQPFGGEGMSGTGPKAGGPHYLKRFLKAPLVASTNTSGKADSIATKSVQKAIDDLAQSKAAANWQKTAQRASILTDWVAAQSKEPAVLQAIAKSAAPIQMPGPTGELNVLSEAPRGLVLCLAHDNLSSLALAVSALAQGNSVVLVAGHTDCQLLNSLASKADALAIPLLLLHGELPASGLSELDNFAAVASDATTPVLRDYRIALAAKEGALIPLINETSAERYVLERHLCVDTTAAGGNASLIATVED